MIELILALLTRIFEKPINLKIKKKKRFAFSVCVDLHQHKIQFINYDVKS